MTLRRSLLCRLGFQKTAHETNKFFGVQGGREDVLYHWGVTPRVGGMKVEQDFCHPLQDPLAVPTRVFRISVHKCPQVLKKPLLLRTSRSFCNLSVRNQPHRLPPRIWGSSVQVGTAGRMYGDPAKHVRYGPE